MTDFQSQRGTSGSEPDHLDNVSGEVESGVSVNTLGGSFKKASGGAPEIFVTEGVDREGFVPEGAAPDILRLAEEVQGYEGEHGGSEAKGSLENLPLDSLDLSEERRELTESHNEVFRSLLGRVKKVMEFLVVKPAAWLGNCIKDHPFKTAILVLAGFGLWYFGVPLSAGLSGLGEEGLHLTEELLTQLIHIDHSQIDVFSDLFT